MVTKKRTLPCWKETTWQSELAPQTRKPESPKGKELHRNVRTTFGLERDGDGTRAEGCATGWRKCLAKTAKHDVSTSLLWIKRKGSECIFCVRWATPRRPPAGGLHFLTSSGLFTPTRTLPCSSAVHFWRSGRQPRQSSARCWTSAVRSAMGAKRVFFWRQPPERRTMVTHLSLAKAASTRLNVLDTVEHRWSAEVLLRKRAVEPEAPGMFVSLTASGVAEEVFLVTLDAAEGGAFDAGDGENANNNDMMPQVQPSRSVLVLRAEKRTIQGSTEVKEYFSRCKTHSLAHRARVEGTQFFAGDFCVRVGKVENMQGSYAGTMVEVEYVPVSIPGGAGNVLDEYGKFVEQVFWDAERENGNGGQKGALVAVPSDEILKNFGLQDVAFGDAHEAVLYVACIMSMQS